MRCLNRLSITVASIALVSSCLAPASGSPATSAPSPQARQLVTQVYDVHDILRWLNPPTTQPADKASEMAHLAHLEQIVADKCGEDIWHEYGGRVTELPSSGQLVVIQTELNQKRIENCLYSLRHSAQARMIKISVDLLSLGDSDLTELPNNIRHQIQQVKSPNVVIAPVSQKEVQALVARAAASERLFGVPRITLFSGENGTLGMNTQVNYIDSLVLSPVTKQYVAHTQFAPSGIHLDVQATVDPTGKVVVHLNSVVTVLDSLQEVPFIAPDGSYPGDVEMPIIEASKVDCKLAAADGSTYLIAGRFPQRNLPTKLDIVPSFKESLNPRQPFVLLVTCRILDFPHTVH